MFTRFKNGDDRRMSHLSQSPRFTQKSPTGIWVSYPFCMGNLDRDLAV